MSPLDHRAELEQRRLGMRSLDPAKIEYHFGRAAALRTAGKSTSRGSTGTKGSSDRRR